MNPKRTTTKTLEQELRTLLRDPGDMNLALEKFESLRDLRTDSVAHAARHRDSELDQEPSLRKAVPTPRWKRELDLPSGQSYGGNKHSPTKLEDLSKKNPRPEHFSEQFQELLLENSRLREENRLLRVQVESLGGEQDYSEVEGGLGAIESIVAGARADIGEIPEVDLSQVPLFLGGRGSDPIAHLREHYGQWLTYFGANDDKVFQDQVRKHDLRLVKTLSSLLSKRRNLEETVPFLSDILPSYSDRNTRILNSLTLGQLLQDPRLARLLYSRLHSMIHPRSA